MIDPVSSSLISSGTISTDANKLAAAQFFVIGSAADGVTQVLLRVFTLDPSTNVTLTILNDQNQPSSSTDQDGGLSENGGIGLSSSLDSSSQNTADGPYAFAVYHAPNNFYRDMQDSTAVSRNITVQAQCTGADGVTKTTSTTLEIVRPPVILIHGLWSSASAWDNFIPVSGSNPALWNNMQPFISTVDYSNPVPGITALTPTYPQVENINVNNISANALGFSFNAPIVLKQIRQQISEFEQSQAVAAVQADVVAHSMGGDIVRTMVIPSLISDFVTNDTYGFGPIHKLITIGTPHQGTPLATQLLPQGTQDLNKCVRNALALGNLISLQDVNISGTTISGAVADLEGDGTGGSLSPALSNLINSQPFPTAYIAGVAREVENFSDLSCTFCKAATIREICGGGGGDPLAIDLTPELWPNVFTIPNLVDQIESDVIVPLASQLNQTNASTPVLNVIHSSSLETLDFDGPSELDSQSGIPDRVVFLLNEANNGSDFIQ